jgi:hypothetical protein
MALRKCPECGHDVSSKAERCPNCGVGIKRKGMGCGTAILVVAAFAIFAKLVSNIGSGPNTPGAPKPPPAPSAKEKALSNMTLDFTWSTTGFGDIMEANFTITNKGTRDVKDITVRCNHFAKSGTLIDHNTRTIYEVFPAGKARTIPKFNMGFIHTQAEKSACSVTDLALVEKQAPPSP